MGHLLTEKWKLVCAVFYYEDEKSNICIFILPMTTADASISTPMSRVFKQQLN